MFYLKYRPQTVAEIDNTTVRNQFSSLLQNKSIPHALLFTGPKGVGKTSLARIVAKSVNCEKNRSAGVSKSFEPCNSCHNCISIINGNSIDVIEIDAASNRKIDEIRDLISKISFLPIHNQYKVYIIDEVHMLTKEAFNALLKTLEEPPQKTLFILATTEVDKLPKTIISRCLQFSFPKAAKDDILRMLSRIVKSENIEIKPEVLKFIALNCSSSFRDAAKILEQAVLQKKMTLDNVKAIVGLQLKKDNLLKLVEQGNIKEILETVELYAADGGDFKVLIENQLNKLHDLLLNKNGIETDLEESYNLNMKQISRLIKLFQEAYVILKDSPVESLAVEIAIVEYFRAKD